MFDFLLSPQKRRLQREYKKLNDNSNEIPKVTVHLRKEDKKEDSSQVTNHTNIPDRNSPNFYYYQTFATYVEKERSRFSSLLAFLKAITYGDVTTFFLPEDYKEFLQEIFKEKEKIQIHRPIKRNEDSKEYQKITKRLEQAVGQELVEKAIIQSPGWKNALEEDNTIASITNVIISNFNSFDNLINTFFKAKNINNPETQQEVLEILKNLFPKTEGRLYRDFIEGIAFNQDYNPTEKEIQQKTVELFINSFLYGDFSLRGFNCDLYPETTKPVGKVLKFSFFSGGQGVAIFSAEEINNLRSFPKEEQFEKICEAIFIKLNNRISLEKIEESIRLGYVVIKEKLQIKNGETYCLSMYKLADKPDQLQLKILGLTKEIKNSENLWIGTQSFDGNLGKLISATNLKGKEYLIQLAIELFMYIAGNYRNNGTMNKLGKPNPIAGSLEHFSEQSFFCGADLAICLEPKTVFKEGIDEEKIDELEKLGLVEKEQKGNKTLIFEKRNGVKKLLATVEYKEVLKILEFAGRKTASTPIIEIASERKAKSFRYERYVPTKLKMDFVSSANRYQVMGLFNYFFSKKRPELQEKALKEVCSIVNLSFCKNGCLELGIVAIDDYANPEKMEIIKNLLKKIIEVSVLVNGQIKQIKDLFPK